MDVPEITEDSERRAWLVAPRKGLLTAEFAQVMDVKPSAIRAAIRRGTLRGVRLRARGKVYAYAASVDDVAECYGLSVEAVGYLRRLTQRDVSGRFAWVGITFLHSSGSDELLTEFEGPEEFDRANVDA